MSSLVQNFWHPEEADSRDKHVIDLSEGELRAMPPVHIQEKGWALLDNKNMCERALWPKGAWHIWGNERKLM